jgi:hypothetical protein
MSLNDGALLPLLDASSTRYSGSIRSSQAPIGGSDFTGPAKDSANQVACGGPTQTRWSMMAHSSYLEMAAWLGLCAVVVAAFLGPLIAWYLG